MDSKQHKQDEHKHLDTDNKPEDHDHDHKDHQHNEHEGVNEKNAAHNHEHGGFLGENTELYFAIGSGLFWLSGLILSFISGVPDWLPIGLFIVAFLLGGYFTFIRSD